MGTIEEAEALTGAGDFVGASRLYAAAFQVSPDPAVGIGLLFTQCCNLDFAGAKGTLDRLKAMAPAMGAVWTKVESCATAEWTRHARRRDPQLAGKRAPLGTPPPFALLYAKAEHEHASKNFAAAKATLAEIAGARSWTAGVAKTHDGRESPFLDLFDTDDLTGATFPIYQGGTILDLPIASLKSLVFLPRLASDPFHGLWPSVSFETKEGVQGTAQFPTLYVGSTVSPDDFVRLGRTTTFDHGAGYCVAQGLRDFWVVGVAETKSMMGVTRFARIDFAD